MNTAFSARVRRVRRPWLPRVALTGLGLAGLGWMMAVMPDQTPGRVYWPWLLITGVLVVLGVVVVWRHPSSRRLGRSTVALRRIANAEETRRIAHGLAKP